MITRSSPTASELPSGGTGGIDTNRLVSDEIRKAVDHLNRLAIQATDVGLNVDYEIVTSTVMRGGRVRNTPIARATITKEF